MGGSLEYRKLISFGKGGFVVSMPKNWVQEHRLGKGSVVVVERENDTLSLSPSQGFQVERELKSCAISLDNKSFDVVLQMLTSAYLNSYSTITIHGDTLPAVLPQITKYVQKLIALEVVESSKTKLILKDFLDVGSLSLHEKLRKIDIIIRSMFGDIMLRDYSNVANRENDVDKLFFVVLKAMQQGARDPAILKKLKLTLPELVSFMRHASGLEQLADEIEEFSDLIASNNSAKGRQELIDLMGMMQKHYLDTMKAFHKNDLSLAFSLTGCRSKIFRECKKLQSRFPELGIPAEKIANMAKINHSFLRRITEHDGLS
jgi:phosphate uptake regulator